jgi:hypothetical protein
MTLEQCMRCKYVRIKGWKYDLPMGFFDVWLGCEFYLAKYTDATGRMCPVPRTECKKFDHADGWGVTEV